ARCDSCYARLQQKQESQLENETDTAAFSKALTTPEHQTYEQLASYVDGEVGGDDRELLEEHFKACPQCETEVGDLRLLRAELVPGPASEAAHGPQFRWKVWHLWQGPTFQFAARAAAIGAAAVLVVWVATLPMRKQGADQARAPGHPAPTAQQALISLNDGGGLLLLDDQGHLQGLPTADPAHQEAVKEALLAQRLPRPVVLRELAGESSALMGVPEDRGGFRLLNPVGVAVLEDRPWLRWRPLSGATSYEVMVYSEDFRQVAGGRSFSSTRWQPARPLPRGHIYTWQVRALAGGKEFVAPPPSAPQAKFKVLDQAKANQLTSLQQAYGTSHLLLGVLYAQAGLLEEAERELESVVEANPQSPVAEKLLVSVKAYRR
ncbi:MAG: anti-sigma factor family protein, partial [Terriglobales bacterium]